MVVFVNVLVEFVICSVVIVVYPIRRCVFLADKKFLYFMTRW